MPAVLWDFDGTLAYRDGMWAGCLVEVLDEHDAGHGLCAADFRPALRGGFPWHGPDRPHTELARHARTRYGDPTRGWHLFDDTLPALHRLRADGWRHVIVSNHVPELPAIVDHLGLAPHVDAIVNSATTGYEKPHPRVYERARETAGTDELWFVGDNPVADVEGPQRAGMRALLVRRDGAPSLAEAAELISRTGRDGR